MLQAIQSRYRYLPEDALRKVADASEMTPAQIAGVASFYGQFRQRPVGEHIIRVCEGTACHVSGAVEVRTELRRCLGMTGDEDTDPSGQFTVERVACVGLLQPGARDDDRREDLRPAERALGRGRASRLRRRAAPAAMGTATSGAARGEDARRRRRRHVAAATRAVEIRIGLGSCGIASGALEVQAALEDGGPRARRRRRRSSRSAAPASATASRSSRSCDGEKRVLYGNVSPGRRPEARARARPPAGAGAAACARPSAMRTRG